MMKSSVRFEDVAADISSMPQEHQETWQLLEAIFGVDVLEDQSPAARKLQGVAISHTIDAIVDCLRSPAPQEHWLFASAPNMRTLEGRKSLAIAYNIGAGTPARC